MARYSINKPDIFVISDSDSVLTGGNQEWYGKLWQRRAGCGPTVASMLVWYLSRTRNDCEALAGGNAAEKAGFIELMNDMWGYVTPGYRGVNAPGMMRRGLSRYASDRGVTLGFHMLDIGLNSSGCSAEDLAEFTLDAMKRDRPIAFLNLSNGQEKSLDRWHWVTIVAFDPDTGMAEIYDNGESRNINLLLWRSTTSLGGGLVTADSNINNSISV